MTYANFLEDAFQAIRDSAPVVTEGPRLHAWLLSIGELLISLPVEEQDYWLERYGVLLVIKYHHIEPAIATNCLRHGMDVARASWPGVQA